MSVYLDHAATTPMVEPALVAMNQQLRKLGNPSSLHTPGRSARKDIEQARESLAKVVGCIPSEIIFTGSGTESDNTALKGLFWKGRKEGKNLVLISAIEHHAILDPAQWLQEHEGAQVIEIPVDSNGVVEIEALDTLLTQRADEVAVISVMHANNETGAIQPIAAIVQAANKYSIPVHSDAVQSFGKVGLNFAELGLTAMSLSGHKIGGPLGIGVLVLKRGLELPALLHGGGQEREIRSGTLNAPAIVALSAAAECSIPVEEIQQLRQLLENGIKQAVPDAYINSTGEKLPGIVNATYPGTESDTLLLLLDAEGIAASTGSACSAGVQRPSHVLLAMGHNEKSARSSLRFSIGTSTTRAEIERVLEVLPVVIERARAANMR
ncbi:MAG: cysteine desulfurase family protein [Actinobacteria bacterium]|nr:cysteine desulfurase family protein [Actinomycetota bacterium]